MAKTYAETKGHLLSTSLQECGLTQLQFSCQGCAMQNNETRACSSKCTLAKRMLYSKHALKRAGTDCNSQHTYNEKNRAFAVAVIVVVVLVAFVFRSCCC